MCGVGVYRNPYSLLVTMSIEIGGEVLSPIVFILFLLASIKKVHRCSLIIACDFFPLAVVVIVLWLVSKDFKNIVSPDTLYFPL